MSIPKYPYRVEVTRSLTKATGKGAMGDIKVWVETHNFETLVEAVECRSNSQGRPSVRSVCIMVVLEQR